MQITDEISIKKHLSAGASSSLYLVYGDPKEAEGATEEKANVYSSYYVSMPIVK